MGSRQSVLIGVDIGTTNLKAVAFGLDGKPLAKASAPTPTDYPRPDWAEYPHDAFWEALLHVIRELVGKLAPDAEPRGIAFTGMAEAGFPLDNKGNPLYPAISWFDRRVVPQMRRWQAQFGTAATARITGLHIGTAAGILRPLWLRDRASEVFAQTRTWLNLPDYAAYRLCGVKATEYSLASRMMVLDLATRQWSPELLDQVGFDSALFGEPVPSALQIGTVQRDAADRTGLPTGLPLCTAGHDHPCAALGLGIADAGDLLDSIGTAEAVVASLPAPVDEPGIAEAGIDQGIHVFPGRYYAMSGLGYGGGSIDWSRRLLLDAARGARTPVASAPPPLDSPARDGAHRTNQSFDALIAMADAVPAGCDGVFFLPHLRQANPPIFDPSSRGAFVGLSSDTGPGHLARAVLEGLAFDFQRLLDTMSDRFQLRNRQLIATGGGTRNQLLMQIKADVSGLPIIIPDVDEAACRGAAIAAGIGAGVYANHADAFEQMRAGHRIIEPDASQHDFYRERYEKVFVKLYDALQGANQEISGWVQSGVSNTNR